MAKTAVSKTKKSSAISVSKGLQTSATTPLVLLAVVFIIGLFLWQVKSILTAFAVGMIVAYLLDPPVEALGKRGLNRTWASLIPLVGFYVVLFLLIGLGIPLAIREGLGFVGERADLAFNATTQLSLLTNWVESFFGISLSLGTIASWVAGIGESILNGFVGSLGAIMAAGLAVGDAVALILITPLVAFYMLRAWPDITEFITSLIPKPNRTEALAVLGRMDRKIAGFIRGQLMVSIILGLFLGISLQLVGLNLGFILGLLMGFLSFIPVVGGLLGMALTLLVALVQFGVFTWEPYAIILVVFLVGSLLESFILTPKCVGDGVGLHPVWIIFSLLAGNALAGVVGMLLAVPVAAIVSELLPIAVNMWRNSSYYK